MPRLDGRPAGWLLAFALLAATGCASDPAPNVLLISVDTLRRDAVEVYDPDAPAQPNLTAFAAEAVVFDHALSVSSWTLPSHGSIWTGLYPPKIGLTHLRRALPFDKPTLAELLRAEGYETVGFSDGALMEAHYGHDRGFLAYDTEREAEWSFRGEIPRDGARDNNSARSLFDRAIAYLGQRRKGDDPFFLFVHTYAVHDYFMHYRGDVDVRPSPELYLQCLVGEIECRADSWAHLADRYDAGVRHLDRRFGELMAALEQSGEKEKTIVMVVSDHGEGFDPERGRIHHGGRVHADQIRIPVLLRGAGIEPARVEQPFSLVDVLPTILGRLGIDAPRGIDGRDALGEGFAEPRELYAFEHSYRWEAGARVYEPKVLPHHVAVVRGAQWYIESVDGDELYRIDEDPAQRDNRVEGLAPDDELRVAAGTAAGWTGEANDEELEGEALLEHLRSLGYIQ